MKLQSYSLLDLNRPTFEGTWDIFWMRIDIGGIKVEFLLDSGCQLLGLEVHKSLKLYSINSESLVRALASKTLD